MEIKRKNQYSPSQVTIDHALQDVIHKLSMVWSTVLQLSVRCMNTYLNKSRK